MNPLRCPNKLHGEFFPEEGWLEIKCKSRWCGARKDVVVIHRFDVTTGKLLETLKFRDPKGKNSPLGKGD